MYQLGVDVGGTFTDIILADTAKKAFAIHKVPSTSPDPSVGVIDGVRELCSRENVDLAVVEHLFHGTTVATNAILEHKGARTGMLTTRGYRDIIHIGRHQRPQNYSLMQDIPWQSRPLVQRRHRKLVTERLTPPRGEVLTALDEQEVRQAVAALRSEGVDSIAVCFLFSYLAPAHELRAREIIEEEFPEAFVTTSADVSPQFREFERFTTCCLNAFVGPKVRDFIHSLTERLHDTGIAVEPHIMTSNGGVATARTIADKPVYTLLSGPAAGVLGGEWTAQTTDRPNLITFDVGGTSADIGIVTDTGIAEASARDTKIAGYPVMIPMIDIHTIGAGGGSIAYADEGGAFRVGPRSAGSAPGPACYGNGGTEPTVTDANLVLGRLDPDHFLGGSMTLDAEAALRVIDSLAERLGMDRYEAAEGVNTIMSSNMANAIRSRTVQKGHDPRKFALVAFGGAGPMTAVEVARHLKIPQVVVPIYPGITSALGLLTTDLKYDFMQTEFMLAADLDIEKLKLDLASLEAQARDQLDRDGIAGDRKRLDRSLDLRYLGQGYEIRVPISHEALDKGSMTEVWDGFHERHRVEFGHHFPSNPIEIVNLRVTGRGLMPTLEHAKFKGGTGSLEEACLKSNDTYFRVDGKMKKLSSAFYDRSRIPVGEAVDGPAVILQHDSTTVLLPGSRAIVETTGNMIIDTSIDTPREAE
jgi:N-methylhydantoinase A